MKRSEINGERVAMKVYGGQAGWYYFVNDHLGTPHKIVDSSRNVVWEAAYLPFGEAQIVTETVANSFRFPGQYFDAETGLRYNWHRYYDPRTGRYLTPDPIGLEGGVNLYGYALNDSINKIEPKGLEASQWNLINAYDNLHAGWQMPDVRLHGTVAVGLGVTAGWGKTISGAVMIAVDGQGNIGVVVSGGGGGMGGVNAAGGLMGQVTDAETIYDLNGFAVQTGGSYGTPVSVGAEHVVGNGYMGATITVGGGPNLTPGEMHSVLEYAKVHDFSEILKYITDLIESRKDSDPCP